MIKRQGPCIYLRCGRSYHTQYLTFNIPLALCPSHKKKNHVSLTLSFCLLFPEYVSPLSQENLVIKFVHKILYYATSILFTILTFDTHSHLLFLPVTTTPML